MDFSGLIPMLIIAVSLYNGYKKNQEQEKQRLERKKAQQLDRPQTSPVHVPSKPIIIHPLDIPKIFKEELAKENSKGKTVLPSPSPVFIPEVIEKTTIPETTDVEIVQTKSRSVKMVSQETEEAQKFWKAPGRAVERLKEEKPLAQVSLETVEDTEPFLNHEKLVQGIIMAEILQPPRAKRPYQLIYSQYQK